MKNIPLANIDSIRFFERIIDSKRNPIKGRLHEIKPQTVAAWSVYRFHQKHLENIVAIDIPEKGKIALIHCYESQTKASEELLENIFDLPDEHKGECPYCQIGEPHTIDHYLPKNGYPEFSILADNMIPTCLNCNNKKGGAIVQNGSRSIINSFFDTIGNERFLYTDIEVENNMPIVVRFYVENVNHLDEYIFGIIENHFQILDLENRYKRKAATKISSIIKGCQESRYEKNDGINFQEIFLNEADVSMIANGPNHWETVLYYGLAGCDNIADVIFP